MTNETRLCFCCAESLDPAVTSKPAFGKDAFCKECNASKCPDKPLGLNCIAENPQVRDYQPKTLTE